jgi:hypothetical protein
MGWSAVAIRQFPHFIAEIRKINHDFSLGMKSIPFLAESNTTNFSTAAIKDISLGMLERSYHFHEP